MDVPSVASTSDAAPVATTATPLETPFDSAVSIPAGGDGPSTGPVGAVPDGTSTSASGSAQPTPPAAEAAAATGDAPNRTFASKRGGFTGSLYVGDLHPETNEVSDGSMELCI